MALGSENKESEIFQNSSDVTNSLLPNSRIIFDFAPIHMCQPIGSETVKVKRIDSFCEKSLLVKLIC